jgi:succinyl-diaminopimelate desuccinylase
MPEITLLRRINANIERESEKIRDFHIQMLRINSVNSKMGGPGESERADFLQSFLEGSGFKVDREEAPDSTGKTHPNLFAEIQGRDRSRTIWIVSHMDTVPEGSRELWNNDPFDPVFKDGKIFARGASDNGQSLVASLFALRELKELGVLPPCNFGVSLVSDEEFDSKSGVYYLLDNNVKFRKDDLIVVEGGSYKGHYVSISEKHLLWIKLVTHGKQVHASNPSKGVNAHKIGIKAVLELDAKLHQKYSRSDPFFDKEHRSTFVITKKDANVGNINTIPGIDAVYMDFRVLPSYSMDSVISFLESRVQKLAAGNRTKIDLEIIERQDAGNATLPRAEIVRLMQQVVRRVTGQSTKLVGLSGQTVGNIFREYGYSCVGWGCSGAESTAHQPNEYCVLSDLLTEAKVFSSIPLSPILPS